MQAISDKRSEEVSDASAYMWAGGRESFIGAVSGAIFGPFGTLKTLGGKMLFGGVTNGFESMVRQTLDGQGINFKTTLFDAGIGVLTAGFFHGTGKLFKKASPWVKKGASKVNDAIENANNKFKNMSDNFSSRFGNKLAFEGIGGFNGNSPINNVKLKPTRTQIAYNEAMKETKEAAEKQMKKATSKGVSNPNYENLSPYSNSKWSEHLNNKYGAEKVSHKPNIRCKEGYYVEHTTGPIKKFTERNGVSGGHNYDEFKKYFNDESNKYKLIEVDRNNHPDIDGIFDIEYRVEYEKMDYTGKSGTGIYKKIPPERKAPYKKTIYNPEKISDEEIIDLSINAIDEGLLNNRTFTLENQHKTIIQGQVDYKGKVLKFEAYQDSYTGVVENAWPVLEWAQY